MRRLLSAFLLLSGAAVAQPYGPGVAPSTGVFPTLSVTGSATIGGTLGVTGAVNTTSPLGYQLGGLNGLSMSGAANEPAVLAGPFAGASLPLNAQFVANVGAYGFESLTATTSENSGSGNGNCISLTTGGGANCYGTSAGASATTQGGFVFDGSDAGRNLWGAGVSGAIGIGAGSQADGSPAQKNYVVGTASFVGNAGTIIFAGTNTVGDTLNFTISSANSCNGTTNTVNCTTGAPAVVSYTLVSGDTSSATLAGHVAAALNVAPVNYALGDGVIEGSHNLFSYQWQYSDPTNHPTEITGHIPGNWQTSIALTSCTGTCGETVTIAGPSTGSSNYIVGDAFKWPGMVNPVGNVVFGSAFTSMAVSPSYNSVVGAGIMPVAISPNFNMVLSYNALTVCTSCGRNVVSGAYQFPQMTTGQGNDVTGDGATSASQITTGNYNSINGSGADVPSPTAWWQASYKNLIYMLNASGQGQTVSPGQVGIATQTPTATFTIGDAGGTSADGNHIAFTQTTAPTATNGTLDAHASDVAGTVTLTAANPVVTFKVAFATAPHCTVSSPSGTAFTYAASITSLTITGGSATNTAVYTCLQ